MLSLSEHWPCPWPAVAAALLGFVALDDAFLSSALTKAPKGAWSCGYGRFCEARWWNEHPDGEAGGGEICEACGRTTSELPYNGAAVPQGLGGTWMWISRRTETTMRKYESDHPMDPYISGLWHEQHHVSSSTFVVEVPGQMPSQISFLTDSRSPLHHRVSSPRRPCGH